MRMELRVRGLRVRPSLRVVSQPARPKIAACVSFPVSILACVLIGMPGNVFAVPLPGISGFELWLRADSGVNTTGSAVVSWDDQSGNSHTFSQATAAERPTLASNVIGSLPGLRFDGSNDYLSGSLGKVLDSGATIFAIASWNIASSNNDYLYMFGNSGVSGSQMTLSRRAGTPEAKAVLGVRWRGHRGTRESGHRDVGNRGVQRNDLNVRKHWHGQPQHQAGRTSPRSPCGQRQCPT